ncbi:MAG: phosphoribosylanthranilate isomerase, partial [Halioglobus sp.]
RCVSIPVAAEIAGAVPAFVTVVALFVDEPRESIERTLSDVSVDVLQFHGQETPEQCASYQRPWLKAFRMRPELDLPEACRTYRGARGALLDTWQDGVPGGTGKTFDWELARGELVLPVVLAGGLNESNVGDAIRAVRPSAVDVSGGVESAPGVKDHDRIRQFIAAVREADEQLNE